MFPIVVYINFTNGFFFLCRLSLVSTIKVCPVLLDFSCFSFFAYKNGANF